MDYIYGAINSGNVDYKGVDTETAKVSVDNDRRTIAVDVLSENDSIKATLPKDESGKYLDGEWRMDKVIVTEGKITGIIWTDLAARGSFYAGATKDLSAEGIKQLKNYGTAKITRTIKVEQNKNCFVYAYPKELGELTSIINESAPKGDVLEGFKQKDGTVLVVAIDGIDYYVYQSGTSTGKYTYTLQF